MSDPASAERNAEMAIVLHVGRLDQVGWLGPYGIVPGGMDNDPSDHWQPIFRMVAREETDGDD